MDKEEQSIEAEVTSFLGLAGRLNFLGHGVLPQAAFIASHLQQFLPDLKVENLLMANSALHELRKLDPVLFFQIGKQMSHPEYIAFSYDSIERFTYGQTGYISGIKFNERGVNKSHTIDWLSSKQTKVSFSWIGAEIIAALEATDRASSINSAINAIGSRPESLPLVLTVDSMGLYGTISTLHEGKDYRLRPTVSRLRDCYEGER